ncbi:TniQ family protein [Sutcliffiella horikoshii]|uniref:TniQ family protein n=1 Tax=Sutcliffiella horikoshii TaxID=79883 RepID=UPI0020411D4E|nr:TniQ family protein [Sutcliffiella horikoshii]MCM3619777.1 TniQ family protein [Sutcliffiella horikoshii]
MLIYLRPYTNETLISFIYRVAKKNRMDNLKWIFDCFERDLSLKIHENHVNWLDGVDLEAVATYLNITLEEAKMLTVIGDIEDLSLQVNNITKNQYFLYSRTRFCPFCMKKAKYQRKNWINLFSVVCLEHECYLQEDCYNCLKSLNVKDIIQDSCLKCNKKPSDSPILFCTLSVLKYFQKTLNQIADQKEFNYQHPWIKDKNVFISTINFLSLWISKLVPDDKLTIPKEHLYFKGKVLERYHFKNFRTVEQSACLYNKAFDIVSNWPENYFNFLDSVELLDNDTFTSFLKHGVSKLTNTPLWPISKDLTSFLGNKILNTIDQEYIRTDEIKFFNTKFHGNIVHCNLLTSSILSFKGMQLNVVKKAELEDLVKKYTKSFSKEGLRVYWGTSARATTAILKSGLIEDSFSFETGSATTWVIPLDSIIKLEQSIKDKTTADFADPISLDSAFQWAGPDHAHWIIKGVQDELIKINFCNTDFSQSTISRFECYQLLRDEILKVGVSKGFFSVRDLTFILGVKKSDLIHWYNTGRFGCAMLKNQQISSKGFLKFFDEFITTYELSITFSYPIKKILKRNQLGYFNTYSGPKHKDGKRLLFKRKDMEKISSFLL